MRAFPVSKWASAAKVADAHNSICCQGRCLPFQGLLDFGLSPSLQKKASNKVKERIGEVGSLSGGLRTMDTVLSLEHDTDQQITAFETSNDILNSKACKVKNAIFVAKKLKRADTIEKFWWNMRKYSGQKCNNVWLSSRKLFKTSENEFISRKMQEVWKVSHLMESAGAGRSVVWFREVRGAAMERSSLPPTIFWNAPLQALNRRQCSCDPNTPSAHSQHRAQHTWKLWVDGGGTLQGAVESNNWMLRTRWDALTPDALSPFTTLYSASQFWIIIDNGDDDNDYNN